MNLVITAFAFVLLLALIESQDKEQEDPEALLDKAIEDLSQQPTVSAEGVGRLFGLLKGWLSHALKGLRPSPEEQEDEAEELIDELDLDEEAVEEEPEYEEDEEPEYEDEDYEEEEEEYPRPPVRKAISQAVGDRLGDVIAGDEVVAQLLAASDEVQRSRDAAFLAELRKVRKGLAAVMRRQQQEVKARKALEQALEEMGRVPAGGLRAGPYQVRQVRKGASAEGGGFPAQEEILAQADEVLAKGIIEPKIRRTIEMAYEAGDPSLARHEIALVQNAKTRVSQ
ncbi:MAG: hypothetical protein WC145_06485 [Aliarcobacter sp.]